MFYLTLPSNSSLDHFPNNTLTNYITRLPRPLELHGQWEVGIVEFHYPFSWYNVQADEVSLLCISKTDDGVKSVKVTVREGYYNSGKAFIDALNNEIRTAHQDSINLRYDKFNQKAVLIVNDNAKVVLSDVLQEILRFTNRKCNPGIHMSSAILDVNRGVDSLYIYSDVVQPHVVGDKLVPLMRIVPIQGKPGQSIAHTFDHVKYFPVQNNSFFSVEVDIRDDSGKKIPFERGKVVVSLHFRKRRSTHFI